jgi:hypothetical protein
MGRPKELTEEERQELLARGLRPFEVWLPDVNSAEFWEQLAREGEAVRESDRREQMEKVLDAFVEDLWDDLD